MRTSYIIVPTDRVVDFVPGIGIQIGNGTAINTSPGRRPKLIRHKSKYGAIKTTIDGVEFHSRREAKRYQELKILQRAGKITDLLLQPSYDLIVQGVKVCRYIGDFWYKDLMTGVSTLEDCKGVRTPIFRLKAKLLKACYGIDILLT